VFGLAFCVRVLLFQILWVIQVSWLQWLLVMIGMTLSGAVLVLTVAPAFANDKKQVHNNCLANFCIHTVLCEGTDIWYSFIWYCTFCGKLTYWGHIQE